MGRWIVLFIAMFFPSGCATTSEDDDRDPLDASVQDLSAQIIKSMRVTGKHRLAILDFSDVEGSESLMGKLYAEELTSSFFETGQFTVVERQRILAALKEQQFQVSGAVDTNTATLLGRMLGVEVVVIGTMADMGGSFRVNGRLLDVETGTVFAVAKSALFKDEQLRSFLNEESGSSPYRKIEEAFARRARKRVRELERH